MGKLVLPNTKNSQKKQHVLKWMKTDARLLAIRYYIQQTIAIRTQSNNENRETFASSTASTITAGLYVTSQFIDEKQYSISDSKHSSVYIWI